MSSPLLRVLMLTKYGNIGASSRLRALQYLPALTSAGLDVQVQSLLPSDQLQARYQKGRYGITDLIKNYASRCRVLLNRYQFDVIWIEKEALPWWPLWLEHTLLKGVPYVLDYDDAVFHNYDQHRLTWVRQVYGRRLDGLMASAALVVGGNPYLAQRALDAGARRVEILPTVIDLSRYPYPSNLTDLTTSADEVLRIAWIGSPINVRYLQVLAEPLRTLARRHRFVFRVIGGDKVDLPGVPLENLPWSEDLEVEHISACHIGVMPLVDSPFEQGKCGYKLIQYMACGLPVVASPVGVNVDIVQSGQNGFLASDTSKWLSALEQLVTQPELRIRMGTAGRQSVESNYCLQVTGPKLAKWLRQAVEGI